MNTYDDNGDSDDDHDDSDNDYDFSCVNDLTFQLCFTFHKYTYIICIYSRGH